jgi:hypothetical protein
MSDPPIDRTPALDRHGLLPNPTREIPAPLPGRVSYPDTFPNL